MFQLILAIYITKKIPEDVPQILRQCLTNLYAFMLKSWLITQTFFHKFPLLLLVIHCTCCISRDYRTDLMF